MLYNNLEILLSKKDYLKEKDVYDTNFIKLKNSGFLSFIGFVVFFIIFITIRFKPNETINSPLLILSSLSLCLGAISLINFFKNDRKLDKLKEPSKCSLISHVLKNNKVIDVTYNEESYELQIVAVLDDGIIKEDSHSLRNLQEYKKLDIELVTIDLENECVYIPYTP